MIFARTLAVLILIFVLIFALVALVFYPKRYQNIVQRYSTAYVVEEALVFAVINTESHFDKNAVSRAGAKGLMQLMPATAAWVSQMLGSDLEGDDLFTPETNIRLGVFYLSYLQERFDSDTEVLAAYNAGEGTVRSWINQQGTLKHIPYKETQNYVKKVMSARTHYRTIGRLY